MSADTFFMLSMFIEIIFAHISRTFELIVEYFLF